MCGIFAVFCDNWSGVELGTSSEGKYRGPDNSTTKSGGGSFFGNGKETGGWVFGFHRLSINGLDTKSNQPFEDSGVVLICNGEIYNYKRLYSLMPDVIPKSGSDCEVLIHLYLKYGMDFVGLLDGEYSFVLVDKRDPTKTLGYVSRDPFGVRPLYYVEKESNIYFASTLVQLPTMKGVKYFPPGHMMEVGSKKLVRYYSPRSVIEGNPLWGLHSVYAVIRETFATAVAKRVDNTDVPVACLLSGGLDSSIVTAITARIMKDKGQRLKTFSIGMNNGTDFKWARKVAEWCDTDHTEVVVSDFEWWSETPTVIEMIESYDITTVRASVGNYLVAKYIAKNSDCKVILNGDGSDELMGGYLYFRKAPDMISFDNECRRLLEDIHMFDVLRSDRSISSNGLEARTPFLDRGWVDTYLSIPVDRRYTPDCEKKLFREAWDYTDFLPKEVLWRQKEAFSDGISETGGASFFEKMGGSMGKTEKEFYLEVFNSFYGGGDAKDLIPYYWMPRWCDADDPSARTLDIY